MPFEVPYRFRDRFDAGEQLARRLDPLRSRVDLLVLGLPRGGVPVALAVSRRLAAPLDAFLVRKLGHPARPELAVGALALGGEPVFTPQASGLPPEALAGVLARERQELARRDRLYRGLRPPPQVRGRTVLVVDDGLATGSTMRAAVEALRSQGAREVHAAVPVAAPEACAALSELADSMTCLLTPADFSAVGEWYEDFEQLTDGEVHLLLGRRQLEFEAVLPEPAPYP